MPKVSDTTRPAGEASRPPVRRTGAARPRRSPPGTLPDEPELWWESGACRGADPVLFFPPEQDGPRKRADRESAAIALCGHCPVRRTCLDHALAVPERFGVWGGTTEIERRNFRRRTRALAGDSRT
ncbi:MAG TPA: WhiB family transcriptional regulator [Actinocrinis sp.]|nr:WhiB family transcriptional regulator [Actinocrinis sp.]